LVVKCQQLEVERSDIKSALAEISYLLMLGEEEKNSQFRLRIEEKRSKLT